MVEFHPIMDLLSGYPYFEHKEPIVSESETYTENGENCFTKTVEWCHSLDSVIGALLKNGLVIESFKEHDFTPYNVFPDLEEVAPSKYIKKRGQHNVPLLFSLKAKKL